MFQNTELTEKVIQPVVDVSKARHRDYAQEKRPALSFRKPLTILLVDDQPEAITPLKVILRAYDCKIVTISKSFESQIENHLYKADVIILDWNLGVATAREVMDNCSHWISQFTSLDIRLRRNKTKIITLTGENARPNFSLSFGKYFSHIEHWSKNLEFPKLKAQILETLNTCGL